MNEVMIKCIAAGCLGVIIHCAIKAQGLKKDALAANDTDWNIKDDYLKVDSIPIVLSFLTVALWYLIFGEAAKAYAKLEDYIISSYALVGMVGSYAVQYAIGKSKGLIRKTVDNKTNQLDEMLNNQNEEEMEELEYYFPIPENAIGIGTVDDNIGIGVYAQMTSGIYEPTELIYYIEPSVELEFVLSNNTSSFVGHIPRPRKPR
jgi:hypothetical protein